MISLTEIALIHSPSGGETAITDRDTFASTSTKLQRLPMQQIKQTDDYTIFQKRSGRYAVQGKKKQWINGDDKTKILVAETLIKLPEPKAAEPEADAPADA